MQADDTIKVWDPLVRIFHWLLAAGFITAYVSGEESQQIHHLAGYLVVSIVTGRVLWGFIGTRHARFRDFVAGPSRTTGYIKDMLARKHPRYLGHNPAGALMVLLLLMSVIATALTGMLTLGVEANAGPLAGWVQSSAFRGDELYEELHEFFANFTVLLVVFHVSGVIVESLLHRDNLIRAMITGRKRKEVQ